MSDLSGYQGDPTRELIEQAAQLQELTRQPGWLTLTALAREAIGAHERRLTSGRLDDLSEYKFTCGWLDGARQLLGIPETVAERLRRREEQARLESEQAGEYAEPDA